ncbi:hypothetical protein [Pseudoalteromonas sp.]|uniref:hypothetical protein n=1 Tax=Pseudoalteromonas sp. TaxID=53249 RepID=UPI001BCF6E6D|nr:hypothetical protein [Pseudoalteromonas sp.]
MSGLSSVIKLSAASVAISMLLSGCTSTITSSTTQNMNASVLDAQLNNLVSNKSCTASYQCKVLEVGARPCGGPSKYVVYSTLNHSQEQAEQLAQKITQQEQQKNAALESKECSPVLEIHSLCIDNQCKTVNYQ